MNKLEIAKKIIKDNYKYAKCGIFDCRNILGDPMINIYRGNELIIDICYDYSYFEIFGLSDAEFKELAKFYNGLETE